MSTAGESKARGSSAREGIGRTLFRLGRVSNLPTVWSNCVAGAALACAEPDWRLALCAALGVSAIYTGGMFLNDAFDHEYDQAARAQRPIPAGAIGARTVYVLGFLQLGLGAVGVGLSTWAVGLPFDPSALVSVVVLGALVVLYNAWHKGNPASPVLMAGCRALVYVTTGFLVSPAAPRLALWLGALALALYVVGLTWLGKLEARGLRLRNFGGFASFIAGISLLDATALVCVGRLDWALGAALGFPATLALQRWVRGT